MASTSSLQPVLDTLDLPLVQEMTTDEQRMLAELKPPGMEGSLLQNLGRRPLRTRLWGIATGADAAKFIQDLTDHFSSGAPIAFSASIVADAQIDQVVIADLQVRDVAGKPDCYAYALTLAEYIKPIAPEDTSGVDADLLGEAGDLMKGLVDGLDAGALLIDGLRKYIPILSGLVTRVQQANAAVGGGSH